MDTAAAMPASSSKRSVATTAKTDDDDGDHCHTDREENSYGGGPENVFKDDEPGTGRAVLVLPPKFLTYKGIFFY
jgi:hypothetical protein